MFKDIRNRFTDNINLYCDEEFILPVQPNYGELPYSDEPNYLYNVNPANNMEKTANEPDTSSANSYRSASSNEVYNMDASPNIRSDIKESKDSDLHDSQEDEADNLTQSCSENVPRESRYYGVVL